MSREKSNTNSPASSACRPPSPLTQAHNNSTRRGNRNKQTDTISRPSRPTAGTHFERQGIRQNRPAFRKQEAAPRSNTITASHSCLNSPSFFALPSKKSDIHCYGEWNRTKPAHRCLLLSPQPRQNHHTQKSYPQPFYVS